MDRPGGAEVVALRKTLRLTQEAFARELEVTVSTVNRWENGHSRPSRLASRRLADIAHTLAAAARPLTA